MKSINVLALIMLYYIIHKIFENTAVSAEFAAVLSVIIAAIVKLAGKSEE